MVGRAKQGVTPGFAGRMNTAARRNQRGAAALFLAISLVALLMAIGFALELGQLYAARADLRKQAELVALDTITAAGGCVSPELADERQSIANAAAASSVSRSAKDIYQLGNVILGTEYVSGSARMFAPTLSATNADAVSVTLSRPLPLPIMPLLPRSADGRLTAIAEATRAPVVTFTVGSYVASLDPIGGDVLNNLLGGALGSDPGLTIADGQALIDSSVGLLDLTVAAGVETVSDLLAEPVTLPGLLQLLVNALLSTGDAAAAAAVSTIAATAPATAAVPFADMAGLPSNVPAAAQEVRIQTFDVVRAAVFQARPVFSITPNVEVPGLAAVGATINLLQPPTTAIGPVLRDESGTLVTKARNQQAEIGLNLAVQPVGLPVANLRLQLVVGEAEATLVDAHCGSADDPEDRVALIADTKVATLRIDDSVPLLMLPLPIIGSVAVYASAEVQLGAAATHGPHVFFGPFDSNDPESLATHTWNVATPLSQALTDGLGSLSDSLELRVELPVLGPLVSDIVMPVVNTALGALTPLLSSIITGLGDSLLDPLLGMLGLSVGGANITVQTFDVPPPALISSR